MDLNFHYYAVKAIASRAGFPEPEAQLIASYSQFVDDFSESGVINLDDVPEYARHLAVREGDHYRFKQVTTGFNSWFDMAALALPSNQKWIVMPFHFFPRAALNTLPDRINWRVVPARMDTASLLRDMLAGARNDFTGGGADDRLPSLIQIGTLLHIFADTYAHQKFSGFWGWENNSYLRNVTNNITNTDITGSYWPRSYFALSSIGHTNVGHAPDDSNVRFTMTQRLNPSDNYSVTYTRSNTEVYCDAAKEILNYLRSCLGDGEISHDEWAAFLEPLTAGFRTTAKDAPTLNAHWNTQFGVDTFHYDNSALRLQLRDGRQLEGKARAAAEEQGTPPVVFSVRRDTRSDMWFQYNVVADSIRVFANGEGYHAERAVKMDADMAARGGGPAAAGFDESWNGAHNHSESEVKPK